MHILFCDNGLNHREVDEVYLEEYLAVQKLGLTSSLISFEALKEGEIQLALKAIKPSQKKEVGLYRGWMLTPHEYEKLYETLLDKNIQLMNSPSEYTFCHYLPENYPLIQAYTPKTTFKRIKYPFDIQDFKEELAVFEGQPIILKDYVKSQKHYWEEACFIPNASDVTQVRAVIDKFLALQGAELQEGLVFRAYLELEKLSNHTKSGMPLTKEFRVFIKNKSVMSILKYWDEGDYQGLRPVLETFEDIIPQIKSNFFTMDVAQRKDGGWIIVELGDGQVAGLPEHADKESFYAALVE